MSNKNFFYRVNPESVLSELTAIPPTDWLQFLLNFLHDLRNDEPVEARTELASKIIQEAHKFRELRSKAGKASAQQRSTNVEHMLKDVQPVAVAVAVAVAESVAKAVKKPKPYIEKEVKTEYREKVFLTEKQHDALNEKIGEEKTTLVLEKLSLSKLANSKMKYDSDYHAILKWVVSAVEKEQQTLPFSNSRQIKTFGDIKQDRYINGAREFAHD